MGSGTLTLRVSLLQTGNIPAVTTSKLQSHRLAVLGDVHGNWRALAATLNQVRARDLTQGVLTGDLVMRGEDPERCVRAMRRLEWPGVAGNTDLRVVGSPPRPKSHPASSRVGSRSWTFRALSKRSRRYLSGLPLVVVVQLGGFRVIVVHGTPSDPQASLFDPESSDTVFAELADTHDADVIVSAHTHMQMAVHAHGRLFVNPGSVGESLDVGDRRPHWAWLETTPDGVVAHLEAVEEPTATVRIPMARAAVTSSHPQELE